MGTLRQLILSAPLVLVIAGGIVFMFMAGRHSDGDPFVQSVTVGKPTD